jgi:hypothetical protein
MGLEWLVDRDRWRGKITWIGIGNWSFSFLFLNFFRGDWIPNSTVVLFLNISEVVEFQIPLLDVVVTWKNTGSVEAENRAGRELAAGDDGERAGGIFKVFGCFYLPNSNLTQFSIADVSRCVLRCESVWAISTAVEAEQVREGQTTIELE